ncbi:hypothetical protein HPT27_18335 [Permianibacter sp. IMCC34836]|uniref:ATP-binding protein n=1 Tax=Permianibacter fluminis TaxID=2738515 RepID=UPI0015563275|nr:ATP-binding protein [Permianibacter fluminis]NQD38978.1 hypothetical protein [Permianibacter fluminis]
MKTSSATPTLTPPRAQAQALLRLGGFVLAYVLLDWLSYIHPVGGFAITPWNPHPGLALALLLVQGRRALPVVMLAAALSEVLVRGHSPLALTLVLGVLVSPSGYALLARFLTRGLGFDPDLPDRHALLRLVLAAIPGTLLISLLYVTSLSVAGLLPWLQLPDATVRLWIGDLIGVVITTPLLLVWRRPPALDWRTFPLPEAAAIATAMAVVLWLIFGWQNTDAFQFFYLLFVPLIWAALRFALHGATLLLMTCQLGLILAVEVRHYDADTVIAFQFLMLALAVAGLVLGMAVSEGRRAQEVVLKREGELHQALRMAAAGELASSLAHELNQPLAAISNYIGASQKLAEREPPDIQRLRETLQKAGHEVQRAGAVVHRLRRFFRSGELQQERLAIADLVSAAWEPLARRAVRARIEYFVHLPADLPDLYADRVQSEIVLHNLLGNALDALESRDGGHRSLTVAAVAETSHVRFTVTDTGPGIAPALVAQLFESFVTSKAHGMGLGLNISRSLVEAHGGHLWLAESRPGRTRFSFTLPAFRDPDAPPQEMPS